MVGLVPAIAGVLLFLVLFAKAAPTLDLAGSGGWNAIGKVAAIAVISFGCAALLRLTMSPIMRRDQPATPAAVNDANAPFRNQIAHGVLIVGGASIGILTLTLVIALSILATKPELSVDDKIDSLLTGIFGAVLPILATWVGTVIAFYFTNESYRQAAAATLEASTGQRPIGPKVASIMKPYEQIINKFPVPNRTEADKVLIKDIMPLFDKVSRVMIFEDKAKNPVYIIRKKLVPEELARSDTADVAAYRAASPELAADSKRFGFLAEAAAAVDAKRIMQDNRFEDLFVTRAGQPTEEVLGWVSDDAVKDL